MLHTVFTSVRIGNLSVYKSVGILEPSSDHYVFIQIFSMTILSIQIYGPTFILFVHLLEVVVWIHFENCSLYTTKNGFKISILSQFMQC